MHNLNVVGAQLDSPRPTEAPDRSTRTEESSFKRHFDREVDQSNEAHQLRSESHARSNKNEPDTGGRNRVASPSENSAEENTDARAILEGTDTSQSTQNEESESIGSLPSVGGSSIDTPLQSTGFESPIHLSSPLADSLSSQRYFTQLKQSEVLPSPDLALDSAHFPSQFITEEPVLATIAQPPILENASLVMPSASIYASQVQANGQAKESELKLAAKIVTPSSSQAINGTTDSAGGLSSELLSTRRNPLVATAEMKPLETGLQQGSVNSSLLMSDSSLSSSFAASLSEQAGMTTPGMPMDRSAGIQALGQTATPARFEINVEFGRAEWNSNVAAKVAQMAAQNLNFAEIQLDPPELGPLQVRVQVNSDQATVSFTAQSAQVRDALEQGSQRLREMLEAEGMNLVDVDVSDQQQQQNKDELDSDNADEMQISSNEDTDQSTVETQINSTVIKAGVDDFV